MRNTKVSVLINKLGVTKVNDPILVEILQALNDDSRDVNDAQLTKITLEEGQQNFVEIGDVDYLNPDFSNFATQEDINNLDIPDAVNLNNLVKIFYKQAQTKSNSVTAQTSLITPSVLSTPPNLLNALGKTFRVRACGYFSNPSLGPTLNMRVAVGGCQLLTGARQLKDVVGNQFWELDALFTCQAVGSSGQLIGQGKFHYVVE